VIALGYDKSQGFFWLPKKAAQDWLSNPDKAGVVKAANCPDQRVYRRLTRSEREQYLKVAKPQ
jgi:hypothetical protein